MKIISFPVEQRPLFLDMVKRFIIELLEKGGGYMLPTPKTITYHAYLFDMYLQERLPGIVLTTPELEGFLLWGGPSSPSPFDTNLGVVAHGWGGWVDPNHRDRGIGRTLWAEGENRLRSMGFDTLVAGIEVGNPGGIGLARSRGLIPLSMIGTLQLRR